MSLRSLYHVWEAESGSFEDCEGEKYHQIESMSAPEYVAERWVEERYDPHHDYASVGGDGILVVVRDSSGTETTVRVHGEQAIRYSSTIESTNHDAQETP